MRAIALALLLAAPALAQDPHTGTAPPATLTATAPVGAEVGRIIVRNDLYGGDWGNLDREDNLTIDLPVFGSVTFHVVSTWNAACQPDPCPDRYEVISVPDGYLVIPAEAEIPEEGSAEFVIYRAEGS